MSYQSWINYIQNAEKTSCISGSIRKIHYKMKDGAEMIEEYSMNTGILIKRAWKKRRDILCMETDDMNSVYFDWDIELGDILQPIKTDEFLVKASISEVGQYFQHFLFNINLLLLLFSQF